jgi:hypothetical protein
MKRGRLAVFLAVLDIIALFTAAGFVYVAVMAVVIPNELTVYITNSLPVRRDTFGAGCFAISALAFLSRNYFALRNGEGADDDR